jgi:hypothetical protein
MKENKATQMGPVETRTTELATLVYSNDAIHVAKWKARKIPEIDARNKSFRFIENISYLYLEMAIGRRNKLEIIKRTAAIANDGASRWANFINNDAVETARMAMKTAIVV